MTDSAHWFSYYYHIKGPLQAFRLTFFFARQLSDRNYFLPDSWRNLQDCDANWAEWGKCDISGQRYFRTTASSVVGRSHFREDCQNTVPISASRHHMYTIFTRSRICLRKLGVVWKYLCPEISLLPRIVVIHDHEIIAHVHETWYQDTRKYTK